MKLSSRLWRPTRTAFSSKMSAIPSRDLCSVMEGLKYAKYHEWAKVDEGKFGYITQASTVGSVDSVKASTDIKSPVSG
ncbi:hypothetical protein C1H46_007724 [Malus baccata]|uniref:Uncharacterized protein n=1 Tax=Malus baccata TaxID=106549 RepID=A0A540N6I5_MALBA|nr:hypothetical protein C1H46_007724 [Malus baccata]